MGLVSSAACCAAEAACCGISCLSCCCRGSGKGPSKKLSKVFYLFFIILATVGALVLRAYGDQLFVSVATFKVGCDGGADSRCYGDQAVYRISFSLACFFALMLLGAFSSTFFRHYWGVKMLLFVVLAVVSFVAIPNSFFNVYVDIARVVSVLFLLLTIIILVSFSHDLQDMYHDYVEAEEEDENGTEGCCAHKADIMYLVLCGTLCVGAFAGIVAMYAFAVRHGCSGTTGLLSVTLIGGFAIVVMSVLDVFGAPGLLSPSVVFLYCTWLMWSAMTSNPDDTCNPVGHEDNQPWYLTVVGIIIAGLSLAYTAYSAANSVPGLFANEDEEEEDLTSPLMANRADTSADQEDLNKVLTGDIKNQRDLEAARAARADDSDDGADSDDDRRASRRSALAVDSGERAQAPSSSRDQIFYVIVLLTASLYMAMLLTDWGSGTESGSTKEAGKTSFWVKIVTQWLSLLLYLWTLVAPMMCKGRDFS